MQLKQLAQDFSMTPLTDMSILKSKEYVEKQALMTLHYACGFRLDEWKCNDRPDLQNLSEHCGIEVVQDCYPDEWEATRHIEKVWGHPMSEVADKSLTAFRRAGVQLSETDEKIAGASFPTAPGTPEHLLATIRGKFQKLNSGAYPGFHDLGLYVFVDTTFIDRAFRSNIAQIMEEISGWHYPSTFHTLYLDQVYLLCICDLRNQKFRYVDLPLEMRDSIHTGIEPLGCC